LKCSPVFFFFFFHLDPPTTWHIHNKQTNKQTNTTQHNTTQQNHQPPTTVIKEWSIFAIRNLCENNLENQSLIASLEPQSIAPDESGILASAGVQATLNPNGKVRVGPVGASLGGGAAGGGGVQR
jgi:hypothetical protein